MFEFLLIVHIAAGAAWLGANLTRGVVGMEMRKGDGAGVAQWYRTFPKVARVIKMPAAILILITGFWMLGIGSRFAYSDWGVVFGIVVVGMGIILGMVIFGPKSRAAATSYEQGDTAEAKKAASLINLAIWFEILLLVVAVVGMVSGHP